MSFCGKGRIFVSRIVSDFPDHMNPGRDPDFLILVPEFDLHDRAVVPEGVDVDLEILALPGEAVARLADRVLFRVGFEEAGEVFPPQSAYMARLNDRYRYHILIKTPVGRTKLYRRLIETIKLDRNTTGGDITMIAELNPYSMT